MTMAKVYHLPTSAGFHSVIDAETCPELQFCQLSMLKLSSGQRYQGQSEGFELALVILQGSARITVGEHKWERLGNRSSVFSGKASAVYVPIHSGYTVEALDDGVSVAVAGVKAERAYPPFAIEPDDVVVHHRGQATWTREVHDIIADNGDGRVQRIVIGETYGDAGGWSSYPPHKHDEVSDEETAMEEVYWFQMEPENGFAIQLLYTSDQSIDEAHIVRHGDSFAIHRGYHPVVSAGGYRVYYLWFMGGADGRQLKPSTELQHRWVEDKR